MLLKKTKHSKEGLERIRLSKIGPKNPAFGKAPWNKGKTGWMSESARLALIDRNKSFVYTEDMKRKRSEDKIGEKHWNWKGGITSTRRVGRNTAQYKLWRESVFCRDSYKCVLCGATGCYIEADHIKPWAYFPELRFELSNGRTLCRPCHSQTDTYKGRLKKQSVVTPNTETNSTGPAQV